MSSYLLRPFAAALFAVLLAVVPAHAQSTSVEVSDTELQTYAEAYTGVQEVAEEYRTRAAQLDDQSAVEELRQEFSEELNDVVTEQGMEVTRYNEIFEAVQRNQTLARRLAEVLAEVQSN